MLFHEACLFTFRKKYEVIDMALNARDSESQDVWYYA